MGYWAESSHVGSVKAVIVFRHGGKDDLKAVCDSLASEEHLLKKFPARLLPLLLSSRYFSVILHLQMRILIMSVLQS